MARSKLERIPEGVLTRGGQIIPDHTPTPLGIPENVMVRASHDEIAGKALVRTLRGKRGSSGALLHKGEFLFEKEGPSLGTPQFEQKQYVYVPGEGHVELKRAQDDTPGLSPRSGVKSKDEQDIAGRYDLSTPEGCHKAWKAGELSTSDYAKRLEAIAEAAEAEADDLDELSDDGSDDGRDSDDGGFMHDGSSPIPARKVKTTRKKLHAWIRREQRRGTKGPAIVRKLWAAGWTVKQLGRCGVQVTG